MNILNINSYYFTSTLYKPMEDNLKNIGVNISTYVPVHTNFKARDEIDFHIPDYVTTSICYSKFDRYIFHLKHSKIVKDIFNRYDFNNIDVLHAHSLFSNGYIALQVKKKYHIPYIVAVRSTDVNVFFEKMIHLRKMGINILLNSQNIVFLSKSHLNECINKYIPLKYRDLILNKSIVIPNGIDQFWFENKEISIKKQNDTLRVIFVGNDSKRKNYS